MVFTFASATLSRRLSSLRMSLFFFREVSVLEQKKIDRSDGYTAICEIEHCAEEGLRMLHPRKFVIEQREVEHVHHLAEQEGERGTRHDGFRPYHSIEETVDDITHCSCRNQGKSHKDASRGVRFLRQFVDPPA